MWDLFGGGERSTDTSPPYHVPGFLRGQPVIRRNTMARVRVLVPCPLSSHSKLIPVKLSEHCGTRSAHIHTYLHKCIHAIMQVHVRVQISLNSRTHNRARPKQGALVGLFRGWSRKRRHSHQELGSYYLRARRFGTNIGMRHVYTCSYSGRVDLYTYLCTTQTYIDIRAVFVCI